jgi:hypothetical protein
VIGDDGKVFRRESAWRKWEGIVVWEGRKSRAVGAGGSMWAYTIMNDAFKSLIEGKDAMSQKLYLCT